MWWIAVTCITTRLHFLPRSVDASTLVPIRFLLGEVTDDSLIDLSTITSSNTGVPLMRSIDVNFEKERVSASASTICSERDNGFERERYEDETFARCRATNSWLRGHA
jgi:hypothetical protein